MNMATVLVAVLDAVGIRTLEYLLDHHDGGVAFPHLSRLGLGTLLNQWHRTRFGSWDERSYAARMEQASASADSVIGHREMVGVVDERTYELFPNGFSPDFISALERRIGRKTIFNKMAGGSDAIRLNMEEHARTGHPIVYASKCDPLIQIAMDEAVIPVSEQHHIGDVALALAMDMGVRINRVIVRAFVRKPDGEFERTANRHDAVLPVESRTLVDILRKRDVYAFSVGKIQDLVGTDFDWVIKLTKPEDLFPHLGLRFVHPKRKDNNPFVVQGVINALCGQMIVPHQPGVFIFANFVDTDSLFGHDRDVAGALNSLAEFDRILPLFVQMLHPGDLLLITADHGMEHKVDYGYHSKEPVPLLAIRIGHGSDLGGLETGATEGLTAVGDLVAQVFGCADEYRQSITHIKE
jgi:phosphopentomutase